MFPPIRPSPTMPSFMASLLGTPGFADRSRRRAAPPGGCAASPSPRFEEIGQGDAAGPDAAGLERAQVARGLGLLEVAEAEGLARDLDLVVIVGRDLHAHDRSWSTLVELAGGVEEPRAEPEA